MAISVKQSIAVAACLSLMACNHLGYVGQGGDLVVEGWIMNGEFPIVIVSQTIPAQEEEISRSTLSKYFKSFAVVKLSDGEQEIVLVGKRDKAFMSQYIYTTSEIRGEAGKTYRISVKYDDKTVCASSTIEKNVSFTEVVTKRLDDGNYVLSCTIRNDREDGLDYKCFVWREGKDTYWSPSLFGTIDGRQDGMISFDIFPPMTTFSREFSGVFIPGDTVHIRLCSMKRQMFMFWSAYDNILSFSRNPLVMTSDNLPSMFDGAIGYWTGYGCRDTTIVLPAANSYDVNLE